jgi:nitrogen fixation-related uncharacterized protein
MEAMMLFIIPVLGLVALGGAALTWGVDTRDQYRDDHAR